MTQEEKAKAYDEALDRMKHVVIVPKDEKALQALKETIFPELQESNDDRIRKSLIKFLTDIKEISESGRTSWAVRKEDAEMCKSFLAYLEKQKERGPLTKEEKYILHCIIEYLDDETCPSEWINLLHGIYCLPYGKQKENIEKEYVFRPLGGTDITVAAGQAIKRVNEGERLVLAFNGVYIPVLKGYDVNEIVDIYNTFVEKRKELPFVKDVNVGYPGHYFYDGNRMYLCSSPALEVKQKEQKLNPDKEELIRHCIGLILADATDERFKDYGLTLKDCLTWLGEQKEQKQVNYDAELKKCKDNPLYFFDKYVSIKQKPMEWSEEDESLQKEVEKMIVLFS